MSISESKAYVRETNDQKRVTPVDLLSILALSVALSLLVTFGSNSNTHDADSLLPAFMSTQNLTWYYWDQNRFANVLPLLATPFKDISANFYFQVFLRNLGAYWSIVFGLLLLTDRRLFLERFCLGVLIFSVGAPGLSIFGVAIPHAVSCGLFAAGLLLMDASRYRVIAIASAGVAFFAAFTVNISLLVIVLPISFICLLIGVYGRKTTIGRPLSFALITATAAAAYIHASFFEPKTPSSFRYDPTGFSKAIGAILEQLNAQVLVGAIVVSVTVYSLRLFAQRRPAEASIPGPDISVALVAVTTAWLLVNLSWVQANGLSGRYFNVNVMILLAIVAGWSTTLLHEAGILRFRLIFAPLLIAACAFHVWKTNGPATVVIDHVTGVAGAERAFNTEKDALLQNLPANQPAIFIGNYWYVTPLAFEWNRRNSRLDGYPLADDLAHAYALLPTLKLLLETDRPITIVCIGITEQRCSGAIRATSYSGQRSAGNEVTGTVSAGQYRIYSSAPGD